MMKLDAANCRAATEANLGFVIASEQRECGKLEVCIFSWNNKNLWIASLRSQRRTYMGCSFISSLHS